MMWLPYDSVNPVSCCTISNVQIGFALIRAVHWMCFIQLSLPCRFSRWNNQTKTERKE